MNDVTLHGKPAVKVNAKQVLWGTSTKSTLFNINGKEGWVPKSICEFTKGEYKGVGDIPGTLVIQEWKYKQSFLTDKSTKK